MTDPGREQYSESTLRLAERYGIDPSRLDAMLGKPKEDASTPAEPTREWIDERRIHQPNDVPPAAATTVHKEPVKIVDPVINNAGPKTTKRVKDVRVEGSSLNNPGGQTYVYKKEVTSPVTWIIGIAILALLAIMFFATRGCDNKPARQVQPPTTVTDTVVKTDTLAMKDTVAVPVPVPNVTSPAPPKPRARRASRASSSSRNVALSTTSSFAAQEKLAELKADGNSRARIQRVTKNGVTLYQVRTK